MASDRVTSLGSLAQVDPSATIRPFPTFAANRKQVLNLSSQEDLVPN